MSERLLLITADDFGIGPETSRAILELASTGTITSTVLLVNSPFAAAAVQSWALAGKPVELGWHPCLTLDAPVLPPDRVPSLVGPDGRLNPLGVFLKRLFWGQIRIDEVEDELRAQYKRFLELVGRPPMNVNAHHHIHVFRMVGTALSRVLASMSPKPFVRRVREPSRTLWYVPGARVKRSLLTAVGRSAASRQAALDFPGNDTLIGITDPRYVHDPEFFARWLKSARGQFVELCCHPGFPDHSLVGRDDDLTGRRPSELELLRHPTFLDTVQAAGFRTVNAVQLISLRSCSSRATATTCRSH